MRCKAVSNCQPCPARSLPDITFDAIRPHEICCTVLVRLVELACESSPVPRGRRARLFNVASALSTPEDRIKSIFLARSLLFLVYRPFLLSNLASLTRFNNASCPETNTDTETEKNVAEYLKAAMNIVRVVDELVQAGQMFRAFWVRPFVCPSQAKTKSG